ncbi:MAG: homocysteine S-methyltransferase family protein [Lachnospirales bacterium]
MTIQEKIQAGLVFFDGGTGTMLQEAGLAPGELPECWNLTHPEVIQNLHRAYLAAGCNIIKTNTFGANRLKLGDELAQIVLAGIQHAKAAITKTGQYVALDIGPLGKMLKPLGDLDFEDAVRVFAEVVRLGVQGGVDLILIETMNDAYETKAAVLAAKENSHLPVFVTNVYDERGKLMTGADPVSMIALLEGLRVDALGINCSLGPSQMKKLVPVFARYASLPIIVNPNAGLPHSEGGRTVYDVGPEDFAAEMTEIVRLGARIVGGCCGTTPEYMRRMIEQVRDIAPLPLSNKSHTLVSSYTHAVEMGPSPILIGERLNPTGKKRLKEALKREDMGYILNEGLKQADQGAHVLDVNVGLPGIDEAGMMCRVVEELQAVTDLPLQIDSSSPEVLERSMRRYNGKPLVNSVNGKEESLEQVLPLVAKYGGVLIALTLDEAGIPEDADGRIRIAKKIIERAASYGIDRKDIVVDPLAMTISSDTTSALTTLACIRRLTQELQVHTSLGVSNISFGLPKREMITSTFFAMALDSGLSAAIMNPASAEMMKVYHCAKALQNQDPNCQAYIAYADTVMTEVKSTAAVSKAGEPQAEGLAGAIVRGLKAEAARYTKELLQTTAPMDVVNGEIIPALDIVGQGFEKKTVYLPQLLMSAEAATASFEVIKQKMGSSSQEKKGTIVIATVKGDIHDIGKNIVKVLLENYGYEVIDLGRDVAPQTVLDAVEKHQVRLAGLSALMTTTVPAMEETIQLIHEKAPYCRVVVGGAVLTADYAKQIGADFYGRDAMETVRVAEKVFLKEQVRRSRR